MKKIVSVFLVVLMLLAAAPLMGFVGLEIAPKAQAYSVGDTIQYGTYPQSRVEGLPELQAAANDATWKSYGYYTGTGQLYDGQMQLGDWMQFADFFCGGAKYRAVTFTQYRPFFTGYQADESNTLQDDNGYTPNKTYYFKYEPLIWRVLDPSTGYIMCEKIVDAQAYQNTIYYIDDNNSYYQADGSSVYANDYATSSIRDWLNSDFYETAFTSGQKKNIKTTALNNDAVSTSYSQYNSATTNDKIFLPSYADTLNTAYGFASSYSTHDTARQAQGTDYAKCQGLFVPSGGSYDGNSWWRLRTAGRLSRDACDVSGSGYVNGDSKVNGSNDGVRPACILTNLASDNIQSDYLFSAGTHEYQAGEPVIENEVAASCTQEGSYDKVIYCVNCGEELSRETITTEKLTHTDSDNNGKCDSCGEQMTGGDHCKYCGKIHGGAFGWLVKIFHNIFALFKR